MSDLRAGGHREKKTLFEALIQEIKIQSDDTLIPVFKIPMAASGNERAGLDGPARDARAVRALPPMVGDTGIEPVTSPV